MKRVVESVEFLGVATKVRFIILFTIFLVRFYGCSSRFTGVVFCIGKKKEISVCCNFSSNFGVQALEIHRTLTDNVFHVTRSNGPIVLRHTHYPS